MSRETLTGSQDARIIEISNRWLSFEPITHEDYAISGVLYTVPLGQYFAPDVIFNSGSYTFSSGALQIQKDIHLFETEAEAAEFITKIGKDNIALLKEKVIEKKRWIEIHLINHRILDFSMEIDNLEERHGYRIEIFRSSSVGYEDVPRKIIKDSSGKIISNTYLSYFDIVVDK